MARIRSIHPGLWTDEAFVSISRDARLLFIGLLNECDDQGAFEWKPRQIKMRLCAADDVDLATVSLWLEELATVNIVKRYTVNGSEYGAVRNFREWQRPKKPNCIHPMPAEFRTYSGSKGDSSELSELEDAGGGEPAPPSSPGGSEPKPRKREQVPREGPVGGEISPQMEDGGGEKGKGREEETSLRSAPPDAKLALFRDGLQTLARLLGKSDPDDCRAFMGTLLKHAKQNHAGLLDLLNRAASDPPVHAQSWLIASAKALAAQPVPLLDASDWLGVSAWIARQATTPCTWQDQKVPGINDFPLEATIECIFDAISRAGATMTERPNWDALVGWCRDDLPLSEHFYPTIQRVARNLTDPVRSLAVFDGAVRDGRAAA